MNAPNQLASIKHEGAAAIAQDAKVDMFSARGFALAQRIAGAFASSDAVPAQFRSHNLKKAGNQEQWVENPSAIGNCIVAIEVAQAVGMSVTAVMQNADPIEGKLRWSDRFVVAGINASRRFTPLRFDVKNLGPAEVTYKEKTGWDNQARRTIFTDKTVKLDNLQSIAWALPFGFVAPPGVYTLDQARSAGLPVIEGPPVSMKLAVEEGWYSKQGSKWQTELKHKMLMMRSGRYFGDIHAPDIVMGIGRTSDEERDIIDLTPQVDGSFSTNIGNLKPVTGTHASANFDINSGEIIDAMQDDGGSRAGHDPDDDALRRVEQSGQQQGNGPGFEDAIAAVKSGEYDLARDIARSLGDGQKQAVEQAITNAQPPQPTRQRRERSQGGLGIE